MKKTQKVKKTKNESFEDSLKKVEDIASLLEDGDLPLQKRIENFEQGMKLLKQCGDELKEVELIIKKVMDKVNVAVKVNTKEPTVKISVGKASMDDAKVIENIKYAYNAILAELPNNKENIKNVLIKLTMTKPIKVVM